MDPGSTSAEARPRTVLFVCSGNTCRSPMAASLARKLLAERGSSVVVASAGAFTAGGSPATPEAVRAAASLGADLAGHRSRALTRGLLGRADVIFGLTRGHLEAIRGIDPAAADRVYLLDPGGHDVPDPVGGSQALYDQTALRLASMIEARLVELEGPAPGSMEKGGDGASAHRG
jgi:protein-tyrosine-phosphatase